ncbi:MAG: nucleotidyltransferase [archaeon]|nr:MAG: nucleotidyltransferase [archaeon]
MLRVDLRQEASRITRELGKVVFVGALAINHYARFRGTRDIDLVAVNLPDEGKLSGLGYRRIEGSRNSWYTPRGVKADFYTKDLGGIPAGWIVKTSVSVKVGRKVIQVISLEGLIVSKLRAGRPQDIADLRQLVASRGRTIRWDVIAQIGDGLEVTELKRLAEALAS